MPSINEVLQDQIIHHSAVDLKRIEASQRTKILRMLRALERDLIADLAKTDPTGPQRTVYQQRRLQALLQQTRETIRSRFKKIAKESENDMVDLAGAEAAFVEGAANAAFGVQIASVAMSEARLRSIARDTFVEGEYPSQWWKKQAQSLQDRYVQQMRMGMLRGETLGQLAKRVRDNVMPVSRRNAESLVRSSVMAVLNESRQESYDQMADLIKGFHYLITLDTGTTPYCKAAGGAVLNKEYKVIKGPSWVKPPPNHWGCRSILSPITYSFQELRQRLKGKRTASKLKETSSGTRASMDGKVPRKWEYTDWLKNQSVKIQNEALGPKRAKLFREGKIKSMVQLLDQKGNLLTIPQLKKAIADGTLVDPITGKFISSKK